MIDEYDVPYAKNEKNLDTVVEFFSTLKRVQSHIKLTFITGVYVFPLITLNVQDITTDPEFAKMMGYTEDELRRYFKGYINQSTDVYDELDRRCNGYRFSKQPCSVYNPHFVLQYLHNGTIGSDPPQFLLQEILKKPVTFRFLKEGLIAVKDHQLVDIPSPQSNLPGLLYQTGSLTVKKFRHFRNLTCCNLVFPNSETEESFREKLADEFFKADVQEDERRTTVVRAALRRLDFDTFIAEMNTYYENSVYELFPPGENYYQAYGFVFLKACGLHPKRKERGTFGVRFVLYEKTFAIVLKKDGSLEEALEQAKEDRKEILKDVQTMVCVMGINFSSAYKIHDWKAIVFTKSGEKIRRFSRKNDSKEATENSFQNVGKFTPTKLKSGSRKFYLEKRPTKFFPSKDGR